MLENTASARGTFHVDDADMAAAHARSTFSAAGASLTVLFCVLISWAGVTYPTLWTAGDRDPDTLLRAIVELLKLSVAAAIGALVTGVHSPARRHHKSTMPIAHAQILFCVAGALTMIIIGDSLARAFGAVGVASTVRFRTPMKDPEDATVLFLLIGLGMSVGRGILAVSGVGTLFLCILLWLLDRRRAADVRDPIPSDAPPIAASP